MKKTKPTLISLLFLLCACSSPAIQPAGPSTSPQPQTSAASSAAPVASSTPVSSAPASPAASLPPLVLASSTPPVLATAPTAANSLTINKTSYSAGEVITVSYKTDAGQVRDPKAWVGLLPADVPHGNATENDKYDLAYQYLEGKASGEMTFAAPDEPGSYDLRLHDAEVNGKELASVAFTVSGPAKPLVGNALRLNKSRYAPGETITITLSIKAEDKLDESAWVGIVPSAVDHGSEAVNDQHNLGYKYLGQALFGKTTLPAPKAPGLYDIRLHNTDDPNKQGIELAFLSFVVE